MSSKFKTLYIILIILAGSGFSQAQETTLPGGIPVIVPPDTAFQTLPDTLGMPADTVQVAAADTIPPKKNALEAPVVYKATDSVVMTAGNWAYLYGEANVKYQQIELESETIEMNMDSSIVFAKYGLDSIGAEFGYPLFKDGGQEYESKTMRYNFKTKKGYITDVITQQGEGFVTAGRTKKMENDVLNMVGGKYTTCDEHDHPHFYIQMTKAKVRPKKDIVTGPVYLVIEDVPLYPLMLPFAFFPFSDKYSSGVLFPTFGEESSRGFFLRDGGYYFAFSDYVDLALTGQIFTKGSWGLGARSTYRKRYKYSGNFDGEYTVSKMGDKGLPDESVQKSFSINWSHSQDAKANPFRTFSASVNFATSGFYRNDVYGLTSQKSPEDTKGSSVNITQRFPNNPLSISATMNLNQRSRDTTISMTLPDITVSMSRIFPFKRKNAIGSDRWYEKISMSYTGYLRNSITTKEYDFMGSNLIKDWKNGMQHKIPVEATFNIFNYINISPRFNYTETWTTNKVQEGYDLQSKQIVPVDTTYSFYRLYEYSTSVAASTTIYGTFKPLPFLGDFVQTIRHRVDPSISIRYQPDFSKRRYGYYDEVRYINDQGKEVDYTYSPFRNSIFPVPPAGESGMISMTIDNNLEAKIKSDSDSTGVKKISLIDNLSIGTGYNLVADSFQWSDITVGLRLKLSKSYSLNLNMNFDPYTYDYDPESRAVRRVDRLRISSGKGFGRLRGTSTSYALTLNNDTFKKGIFAKLFGIEETPEDDKNKQGTSPDGTETDPFGETPDEDANLEKPEGGRLRQAKKDDSGEYDPEGYWKNGVPWSLTLNYSLNLSWDMGNFNYEKKEYPYKLTHALTCNGNIQPTKNWRLNFNTTYDFENNRISNLTCNISRDLHCFTMTASVIYSPGYYKAYTFSVAVKSSLLKDLKYDRRSNSRDGQTWY